MKTLLLTEEKNFILNYKEEVTTLILLQLLKK